jgi:hypothetical protein
VSFGHNAIRGRPEFVALTPALAARIQATANFPARICVAPMGVGSFRGRDALVPTLTTMVSLRVNGLQRESMTDFRKNAPHVNAECGPKAAGHLCGVHA